jgi:hypothetical protein
MYRAPQQVEFGYFYDALSGLFWPPSDPKGREHTLGRLMTATFARGQVTMPHSDIERRAYTPSWAPICSAVRVCHDDDIRTLTLDGSTNRLEIVHGYASNHRTIEVFTEDLGSPTFRMPLLGSSSSEIQTTVAELAQAFFDTLSAPDSPRQS